MLNPAGHLGPQLTPSLCPHLPRPLLSSEVCVHLFIPPPHNRRSLPWLSKTFQNAPPHWHKKWGTPPPQKEPETKAIKE